MFGLLSLPSHAVRYRLCSVPFCILVIIGWNSKLTALRVGGEGRGRPWSARVTQQLLLVRIERRRTDRRGVMCSQLQAVQ